MSLCDCIKPTGNPDLSGSGLKYYSGGERGFTLIDLTRDAKQRPENHWINDKHYLIGPPPQGIDTQGKTWALRNQALTGGGFFWSYSEDYRVAQPGARDVVIVPHQTGQKLSQMMYQDKPWPREEDKVSYTPDASTAKMSIEEGLVHRGKRKVSDSVEARVAATVATLSSEECSVSVSEVPTEPQAKRSKVETGECKSTTSTKPAASSLLFVSTERKNPNAVETKCSCKESDHVQPLTQGECEEEDPGDAILREDEAHTEAYSKAYHEQMDQLAHHNCGEGEWAMESWTKKMHPKLCCSQRHKNRQLMLE